jgi:hypothetical protein
MPVVVSGVIELKKALKQFSPDLLKEMNAEIREALKEVTDDAKAKVPGRVPGNLYNWQDDGREAKSRTTRARAFPKYNPLIIRRGLTYSLGTSKTNSRGFKALYSLLNKSASGAIVETAGRKNPYGSRESQSNNPDAGRRFVGAMNDVGALKQYDKFERGRGRLLYAAYSENQGKALDAVMKAIDKAKIKFNKTSRTHNERASAYGNVA